jgi:oligogalacturonide lyase
VIAELEPGYLVTQLNVSSDGQQIYYSDNEDLSDQIETDLLRGYVGFEETWAARPHSRVVCAAVDGSGSRIVFEEDYWIGHVNTSPSNPDWLTFCHEGPWDKVDQRIWALDAANGRVWKLRPTEAGDVVGHEYWLADGERVGYHGKLRDGRHVFGRVRFDGSDQLETAMEGATGHTFSLDEDLVVGDAGGVIRVWFRDGDRYVGPRVLCEHRSSSNIQQLHPHPRVDPTGSYVVFTSDVSGYGNVYTVPIPDDLDRLPEAPQR